MKNNIKALRTILKLSQAEFGERLGVSRDVVGNIEYGRVAPKEVFINHVCAIFNVNKEWLINGAGEPFNSDIKLNNALNEAISLFSKLSPSLQEYALQQLRGLLKVQDQEQFKLMEEDMN